MDGLWAALRDREPAAAMRAWVLEISCTLLQVPPTPTPHPTHPASRDRPRRDLPRRDYP